MAIDMQKHKAEVTEERATLLSQLSDLTGKIALLDGELKAIEAYEKAHTGKSAKKATDKASSSRAPRGAKKQAILDVLKTEGMKRSDILEALGAKGNKSEEQSISNTLATMVKAKELVNTDGTYTLPT